MAHSYYNRISQRLPMSASFVCPPALRPGDAIRIIAPCGPFDRTLLFRGAGWLAKHFRVEFDWRLFRRHGYLAGSDAERLDELNRALSSGEIRAIVSARGGYGATRIAHLADWASFAKNPKWIVGFSDVTALHVEAARLEIASLHAHNAAGLGRGDSVARERWRVSLETPGALRRYSNLTPVRPGRAFGPLAGGNLSLLATCAAAGRLRLASGCVLAIEDVGEAPYRIDRMLSALIASGALDSVAGVLVGEFVDCVGHFGVQVDDVLRERLAQLRVPVLAGFPFGHGRRNDPLPLGLPAELDASRGTLTLCPSGGT
jgi:muramoyltetrapeptide carboxypeptidase